MVQFKGGLDGAVELLSSLTPKEQNKLLEQIAKKDPRVAQILKENLTRFEDLKFISPKMLVELLRAVKLSDFALALRIGSPELRAHITALLPNSLKTEIMDVLNGPPKSVDLVMASCEQVMVHVRQMVNEGRLILSKDKDRIV